MTTKSKPPSRPAPPVPTPRNARSSVDVANAIPQTSVTSRSSQSELEVKNAKMKEEILRYRKEFKEKEMGQRSKEYVYNDCGASSAAENMDSLKKELEDVMEKNAQWQVYNEQREQYVSGLVHKYNDLYQRFQQVNQDYAQLTNNPGKLSEEQRRYFDGLLIQARKEISTSRDENSKLKKDLETLQSKVDEDSKKFLEQLDHWKAMYEQEKEMSEKLREERDRYLRRKSNSNADKENWDRISSLQREMESYREDFKSERHRREDLEQRLNHLQRKVKESDVSRQKVNPSYSHNKVVGQVVSNQRHRTVTVSPPKVQKITTKREMHLHKDRRSHPVNPTHMTTRSRRDKSSRHENEQLLDKMNRTYSEFGHHNDSNLKCPNCGKVYEVDEHEFLLIHIDTCI